MIAETIGPANETLKVITETLGPTDKTSMISENNNSSVPCVRFLSSLSQIQWALSEKKTLPINVCLI